MKFYYLVFLGAVWSTWLTIGNLAQAQDEVKEIDNKFKVIKHGNTFVITPKKPIYGTVKKEELSLVDIEPLMEEWIIPAPIIEKPNFDVQISRQAPVLRTQALRNYLKLGFGNYITPFAEANLSFVQNDTTTYNVFAHHISSMRGVKDQENSAYGNSEVEFTSQHQLRNSAFSSSIAYQLERIHFYGYDNEITEVPLASDIRQDYHRLEAVARLASANVRSKFDYDVDLGLNFLSARQGINEWEIPIDAAIRYALNEKFILKLNTNFAQTTLQQSEAKTARSMLSAEPSLSYRSESLLVEIGGGIAYLNDSLLTQQTNAELVFYPKLKASYSILDENKLSASLNVGGGADIRSLRELSRQNPFLAEAEQVSHNFRSLDIKLGLESIPVQNLRLAAEVSYVSHQNLHFFAPSRSDSSQFSILYDPTNVISGGIKAQYVKQNWMLRVSSTYYNYQTENLSLAHHRPDFENSIYLSYQFNKLRASLQAQQLFGIETQNPVSNTIYEFEPIHLLNLKLDYQITANFAAFAHGYNLLNTAYERWVYYPNNQALGILGVKYSF